MIKNLGIGSELVSVYNEKRTTKAKPADMIAKYCALA